MTYTQLRDSDNKYGHNLGDTTNLVLVITSHASEAAKIFGQRSNLRGSNNGVPIVVEPRNRGCCPWLYVPAGTWAIIENQGRYVGIWDAGYHSASCFTQIKYLVTQQHINFRTEFPPCPSSDNVGIRVQLSVNFHFLKDKLNEFVYNMGVEQLEEQMKSSLDQGVRGLCRSRSHKEAYNMRYSNITDLKQNLNRHFQNVGVIIKDVIIQDVKLPEQIASDLENKTIYDAIIEEQKKNQLYNTLVIANSSDLQLIKQSKEQERNNFEQSFKRDYADQQRKIKTFEAETSRILAQKNQQINLVTQTIINEAEKIATTTKGEMEVEINTTITQAKREAAEKLSSISAEVNKLQAQTESEVAKLNAQALYIEAEAEGKSIQHMKVKRQLLEQEAQYNAMMMLGQGKILISGVEDGNIVNQLVTLGFAEKISH